MVARDLTMIAPGIYVKATSKIGLFFSEEPKLNEIIYKAKKDDDLLSNQLDSDLITEVLIAYGTI